MALRTVISIIAIIGSFLILSAQPGYCGMKIKIKLPVDLKLEPLPLAGTQESNLKFAQPDKGGSRAVFHKTASMEEVLWKSRDVSSSPADAQQDGRKIQSPADGNDGRPGALKALSAMVADEVAVLSPQPVLSLPGENEKPQAPGKSNADSRKAIIGRLNDALYRQHQKDAEVILEARESPKVLPHPPTFKGSLTSFRSFQSPFPGEGLDPRDAGVMTVYRGFSMTKKAAHHFRILEGLIAQSFPGRQVIITSTTGGSHLDVRHYEGNAIDFVVEGMTAKESLLLESLARQAGFGTYNEYIYSSPYKTGDHMHISI